MDGRFLKAFSLLPKQRAVCGYVTRPICFRHRVILTNLGSPFISGEPPEPMDVIIAAKILSQTSLEFMLSVEPDLHDIKEVKKMVEDVEYFVVQTETISELIKEQSHWPIFWKKNTSGKDRGAPWILSLICNLVKNGVPLEDAWTMPESQAVWLHATFCINEGAEIDIVSDDDLAAMEQLKRLEEELKRNPPQPPPHLRRNVNN